MLLAVCWRDCTKTNYRFNWHGTGFKYPEQYCHCRILTNHLTTCVFKNTSYSVKIKERIEGSGRIEKGAIDASKISFKKSRETFWMLQFRTVFPYGLNDRIRDKHEERNTHVLVGQTFTPLERNHQRVIRGKCYQAFNFITPEIFEIIL